MRIITPKGYVTTRTAANRIGRPVTLVDPVLFGLSKLQEKHEVAKLIGGPVPAIFHEHNLFVSENHLPRLTKFFEIFAEVKTTRGSAPVVHNDGPSANQVFFRAGSRLFVHTRKVENE